MERATWKASSSISAASFALRIFPHPGCESSLIDRASGQIHHSLRSILFGGLEVEAVEFEKENTDHKARPLVALHKRDKRMIADDAGGIERGHFDDVRLGGVGMT